MTNPVADHLRAAARHSLDALGWLLVPLPALALLALFLWLFLAVVPARTLPPPGHPVTCPGGTP